MYNFNQLCFLFSGKHVAIHSTDWSFLHLDAATFYDRFLLGCPLEQIYIFLHGSSIGSLLVPSSAVICNISFINSNTVSSVAVFRALQRILPNSVNLIFRWFAKWVLNSFCLIECLRPICLKRHLGTRLSLNDGIKKRPRQRKLHCCNRIIPECTFALHWSSTQRNNMDSKFWL